MESIIKKNIVELYKDHSIVYGTETNRRRMVPDVRDGLKLVQRRDLIVMFNKCATKKVKTASVVGDVMKIHPHGDSSVADSIKLMANWFDCKVPLIAQDSNFGSMQGEGMAATRYTEVMLSKFSLEAIFGDMRTTKDAVDWVPTYDYSSKEPEYLPVAVPLLLINGTSGIGFGFRSEVPKHNLAEVIDATINLIKDPNYQVVLIPDQCMPCEIIDTNWKKISNTGTGNYIVRGIIDIESIDPEVVRKEYHLNPNNIDDKILVIKSTPDGVSFDKGKDNAKCVKSRIEDLATNGKLPQVYDMIDRSYGNNMRIVILLKKGSDPSYVRNILYKNTEMQKSFYVNMVVLEGINIKRFSYKSYLQYFIQFRKLVKFRLYNIKLQGVRSKLHEREAYIKLLESGEIDNVINMLKGQKTTDDEHIMEYLIKKLNITDMQAKFIINSNLKSLSIAYLNKYKQEAKELKALEKDYINRITNENLLLEEIVEELTYFKNTFKEPRKCKLIKSSDAEGIPGGEVKVVITEDNFIKKLSPNDIVDNSKHGIPKFIFNIDNTKNLLIFTEHGRVYKLPVHKIPMGLKNSSGYDIKTIVKGLTSNIVKVLFEDTVIAASKMVNKNFLTIVTKDNCIKNLDLDDVVNAPPSGFIYIKLNDGDVVRDLEVIPSKCDVIIYSNKKALRVKCTDINHYKRNAAGVIAMNTKNPIDGIEPIYPTDKFIIIITSGGKVNKINLSALELSVRGKAGNNVINLGKNDSIIKILGATDKDILRVITINNKIDIPVSDIKVGSSISSGQKLIPTRGDKILNCRIKK